MADKDYILTIDQYGRRVYKDISTVKNINAETLGTIPAVNFTTDMTPEKHWAYRVQGNLTLDRIEYSLYVLDGSLLTTTLTLPPVTAVARGTIITLLNPTKANFAINGNGINIVRVATEAASITLTEYQSIKLILIDIGQDHDSLWYELISIPAPNPQVISSAVETYLIANPPSGGMTIIQIKADTDIASAISLKHSNTTDHAPGSDNQVIPDQLSDLSEDITHRTVTDTEKGFWDGKEPGDVNIQAHVISAHAPSDANNYSHPANHAPSIITQDVSNRFVTDTEKATWNAAGSPFTAKLILLADKPTGANVTPVTLGLSFNYEANSKYVIDIYAIVAPAAATTGCGFMIDVSTAVTYVGTFVAHQLAITGTLSGAASAGDLAAASSGISSGMVLAGSNFVYGGGILITGANAGTATFFFRSETTAVTTCKTGTMFRVMKMN